MAMTLGQAKEKLAEYGQEHVLKYYGELSGEEQQALLDQVEATDMSILAACRHKEDLAHTPGGNAAGRDRGRQGIL